MSCDLEEARDQTPLQQTRTQGWTLAPVTRNMKCPQEGHLNTCRIGLSLEREGEQEPAFEPEPWETEQVLGVRELPQGLR